MKKPIISVIVPIYNVEPYLQRCVDSILRQTYKNLEVILVDDGSPDSCPYICDEYAERDKRVTVIHKKNGGLSSARNAALDRSLTGDYVTFVDSDDWIAPDTYEYCVGLIEKTGAEVVQFDYTYTTGHKDKKKNPIEKIIVLDGKDILQHYLTTTTKTGSYSVCRCLFSKHLIGNTRFREGKINEDIDWKYKVLQRSKKLVDSNQVKYFYYQSGNSISVAPLKMSDFQLREAADLLCELTKNESYGSIAFLGRVKQARTAFSLLCKIAYLGIGDAKIDKAKTVKELTQEHRRNLTTLLKAPIPISRKVLSLMFATNYKMTEMAIHLIKKI